MYYRNIKKKLKCLKKKHISNASQKNTKNVFLGFKNVFHNFTGRL